MENNFVLGIDFGTSTTLVALPGEPPKVIPIGISFPWIPSVIASSDGENWIVGEEAEVSDVRDQIRSPKTSITFNQTEALTTARGVKIDPDAAIEEILLQVKEKCRENGLSTLGLVRMSCPAIWTGENRIRLASIANKVGFNVDVDHIMDEPIAAAVSWWWNKTLKGSVVEENCKAVIFDLGGGTLDVAIVDIYSANNRPEITVMSARGTREAGDKLDDLLAEFIERELKDLHGYEVENQPNVGELRAWIRREAKSVKERLSVSRDTVFQIKELSNEVPSLVVTRLQLEDAFEPQLKRLLACTEDALREAKMKLLSADNNAIMREEIAAIGKEVDFVVLAGGMSQIPIISTELQKRMPNAIIEYAISQERATEAIVEGVSNLGDFANLNVHRPSFDFVMTWKTNDGEMHEQIVFPAFTSLYDSWEISVGKGDLGREIPFIPPTDPVGDCKLIVRSVGGKPVSFRINGAQTSYISLNANRHLGIYMKLYMDGRLFIKDGLGNEIKSRIREWPVVRWGTTGRKDTSLVLEDIVREAPSMPTQHWELNLD
ncbi:DnaK Molecular chaperone [Candidatus Nanopelagicaceae bacterium]